MQNRFLVVGILSMTILLGLACNHKAEHTQKKTDINSKVFQDKLVEANKMYVLRENDEIDQYIIRRKWEMIKTGTGLRYSILEHGQGQIAKPEQRAKVNYRISLFDGTECYSSKISGPKEFTIERDDIESGLHEGIQYMHVGDKALFILPSYLAHGLIGDENKIPPKSSVIYEIELLSLK
jgi:FKBP-type peptidyl-prolyl cis-trans isomerase FkpA